MKRSYLWAKFPLAHFLCNLSRLLLDRSWKAVHPYQHLRVPCKFPSRHPNPVKLQILIKEWAAPSLILATAVPYLVMTVPPAMMWAPHRLAVPLKVNMADDTREAEHLVARPACSPFDCFCPCISWLSSGLLPVRQFSERSLIFNVLDCRLEKWLCLSVCL